MRFGEGVGKLVGLMRKVGKRKNKQVSQYFLHYRSLGNCDHVDMKGEIGPGAAFGEYYQLL